MRRIVVVGGGLAGLEAVSALRAQGFDGELTLVGAEARPPYERPALSKAVLLDEDGDCFLEADWDALGVTPLLSCAAVGLAGRAVVTDRDELPFDGLVVATGAAPIELPGAGARYLRTLDDAVSLRGELVPGARVVVVGAGWIGAEVATAAAARGCSVTVVDALAAPLGGALPAEVGRLTIPWYDDAGVDLRLGVRVRRLDQDGVVLDDGSRVAADCTVVGVGVRPSTAWLAGSGIALDASGHVLVDEALRASRPGVVAAGDCSSFLSRRYGEHLSVQHWDNALRAPAVAATSLLGEAAVHDPVPYFWSDQFGRVLQLAGHLRAGDATVARGDPGSGAWGVCWVRDGRLTALLTVDRGREMAKARRLLAALPRVDVAALADPAIELADAVVGE